MVQHFSTSEWNFGLVYPCPRKQSATPPFLLHSRPLHNRLLHSRRPPHPPPDTTASSTTASSTAAPFLLQRRCLVFSGEYSLAKALLLR
ncbi:hypothetical protein Hanom_Chr16g01509231 [Helianthus anomalus]